MVDPLRLLQLLLPGLGHFLHEFLRLGEALRQVRLAERLTCLCCLELSLEHLHLLAQLADDAGVGVLVDHGVVDDPLGAVSVAQSGKRLLVVVCRGADGGHHDRLAVASQRAYLQEPGEHRVPVGHKLVLVLAAARLVSQGRDDQAEGGQRSDAGHKQFWLYRLLVDVASLLEAVAHGPSLLGALTASQVHQGQLADLLAGH
ncbi:hypothetical protein EGW08_003353, partial [Elysia chlorotica]